MLESAQMQRCTLKECQGACCILGFWLDLGEVERIRKNSALIAPHLEEDLRDPALWFAGFEEEDPQTPSGRVIHSAVETNPEHYGGTACIFCATMQNVHCRWRLSKMECIPGLSNPSFASCIPWIWMTRDASRLMPRRTCWQKKEAAWFPPPADIPLAETFAEELEYLLGTKAYHALLSAGRQNRGEP